MKGKFFFPTILPTISGSLSVSQRDPLPRADLISLWMYSDQIGDTITSSIGGHILTKSEDNITFPSNAPEIRQSVPDAYDTNGNPVTITLQSLELIEIISERVVTGYKGIGIYGVNQTMSTCNRARRYLRGITGAVVVDEDGNIVVDEDKNYV